MTDCCNDAGCEIEKLRARQRGVLVTVLAVNCVMFVVESAAGFIASSNALVADSLDMLGDALVYGFSLYVVARNDLWKARSAAIKGWIMVAFGVFTLGQVVYKIAFPEVPSFQTIGAIGVLALIANAACLGLLWRHRGDDVNMRSVWLCSRNDIVANVSVLFAGIGVWAYDSQIPDLVVGLAIAAVFLKSSVTVLRDAASVAAQHRSVAGVGTWSPTPQ